MTQQLTKTFENSLLVETREVDLATGTFTRRDALGKVVETRQLNAQETTSLNAKAAKKARDVAFAQARADQAKLSATPLRATIGTILDELERLR